MVPSVSIRSNALGEKLRAGNAAAADLSGTKKESSRLPVASAAVCIKSRRTIQAHKKVLPQRNGAGSPRENGFDDWLVKTDQMQHMLKVWKVEEAVMLLV